MTIWDMNAQDSKAPVEDGGPPAGSRRARADRKPKKTVIEQRQAAAVAQLAAQARANGDALTGPSGLLKQVTQLVLEAAWKRR